MNNKPMQNSCPFCHKSNSCGVSAETPCWCFNTIIPEGLLNLLPTQFEGTSCICFSCIQAFTLDPEAFLKQNQNKE